MQASYDRNTNDNIKNIFEKQKKLEKMDNEGKKNVIINKNNCEVLLLTNIKTLN